MKALMIVVLISLLTIIDGCKKFVTIDPPSDQIVNPKPFTNDATATSTITGIYSEMMNGTDQYSCGYTTLLEGLYADELYYYTPGKFDEFTASNITANSQGIIENSFWVPLYKYIYAANLALEQLKISTELSPSVKQRLTGEALFIRVFCYDLLVDVFGDVPMVLHSSYQDNMILPRTAKSQVFSQMLGDINEAVNMLPADYPEGDRTRPNKWAAKLLQSKIMLAGHDYTGASAVAGEVISSGLFTMETDLNKVFLKQSNEAIWQLQPVRVNFNTTEGNLILPATSNTTPTFVITSYLLNAFETGDQRKTAWVKSRVYNGTTVYYPFKYKIRTAQTVTENYVVYRLAELYLIRAEANAHLGNVDAATDDVNVIRTRAGLAKVDVTSQQDVLQKIEQERRIELCFEWGRRWFDLKRTSRAKDILSPIKSKWSDNDTLWPIPENQLHLNPSLTQNAGY